MNNVIFTTVVRRTAPGRILDQDLLANGVVVETGSDFDIELAKLAFAQGRRALPQEALDAYVPPPEKPGKKKIELAPPSLAGVARIFIELRTCDASVGHARRIFRDAAGYELDETPRRGYVRDSVHNLIQENYEKYEERTQWFVKFYGVDGKPLVLRWTCKETGEPQKRLWCKRTALHLLRSGYTLGYNDVHAEDRVNLDAAIAA